MQTLLQGISESVNNDKMLDDLIDEVSSKKGTTEAAIKELKRLHFLKIQLFMNPNIFVENNSICIYFRIRVEIIYKLYLNAVFTLILSDLKFPFQNKFSNAQMAHNYLQIP